MPFQKTQVSTLITEAGKTQNFFNATFWCRAKLLLETAGPVSVGLSESLGSALSGRGILLPSGGPEIEIELQNGDRLYYVATAINRVKLIIEPVFLQEATSILNTTTAGIVPGLAGVFGSVVRAITGAPKLPEPVQAFCPPALKPPRF